MKKKNIVKIVLLIIIIIAIATFFIIRNLREEAKNYEITDIPNKDYQYFAYKQDEKFGIIDKTGKVIIQASYTNVVIPNPTKAVFICYNDKNTKVLNENNEEIYTNYQNIEPLTLKNVSTNLIYEKTVLKYQKDGKYGLINIDGKKITNAEYEEIDTLQYKEGELLIKQNGKYGVMNINGYEIIKPEYDKIEADGYYSSTNEYKNDGYIVSNTTDEGYRYGYIKNDGQKILEVQYNDLKRVAYKNENDIYILCAENGKYGLYKEKQNIIPNEYQAITYVDGDEICVVQKGKKYGVITLEGSMILQVKYSQIDVTGDYIYVTDENLEQKVFDKKGNESQINPNIVISTVNTDKNYKVYIDSTSGKTVYSIYEGENKLTTEEYSYIKYLYDDYFIASNQEGKLGVIDKSGNVKIEMKYDSLQKINDAQMIQAMVSSTKTTDIFSKDMTKVYEIVDGNIEKIDDSTIKVYNTTDMQYFDLNGNIKESKAVYPNNNLFAKKENDKWGFIDANGNVIVDYQYDEVTEQNEYGYAGIKKDGKWGIIDQNGNVIVENKYEINSQDKMNFVGEYYAVIYGNRESYYTK